MAREEVGGRRIAAHFHGAQLDELPAVEVCGSVATFEQRLGQKTCALTERRLCARPGCGGRWNSPGRCRHHRLHWTTSGCAPCSQSRPWEASDYVRHLDELGRHALLGFCDLRTRKTSSVSCFVGSAITVGDTISHDPYFGNILC